MLRRDFPAAFSGEETTGPGGSYDFDYDDEQTELDDDYEEEDDDDDEEEEGGEYSLSDAMEEFSYDEDE